jgi:hypothetical protein
VVHGDDDYDDSDDDDDDDDDDDVHLEMSSNVSFKNQ